MRAKYVHHTQEWLPTEYDPPASLLSKPFLTAWRVHRDRRGGSVALKLNRGVGIWNREGRILHYDQAAADVEFTRDSQVLYSLQNVFGPCVDRDGVRHALVRRDANTFNAGDLIELCVPKGGVEYLVLGHRERSCVATWLDQTQWGYVVVDLVAGHQTSQAFYDQSASLSPPAFSPDDRLVVACCPPRSGWWTEVVDDYWEQPSPGGRRKVGSIAVHDLSTGRITRHEVAVFLPPNWIPDKPTASEWSSIWGPAFLSDRQFKIWLPDDSEQILDLPLPPTVEIRRPIGSTRTWLG